MSATANISNVAKQIVRRARAGLPKNTAAVIYACAIVRTRKILFYAACVAALGVAFLQYLEMIRDVFMSD